MLKFLPLFLFAFLLKNAMAGKNDTLGALWNLQEMAECRLQYSALIYNDYGCWCGVGGSGEPVDKIDE